MTGKLLERNRRPCGEIALETLIKGSSQGDKHRETNKVIYEIKTITISINRNYQKADN